MRGLLTRKLASLLLEASKARSAASGAAEANGGAPEPAAAPADASGVDLTGEREFLVAESAQEALASMLAERSTVSRVSGSPEPRTQAFPTEQESLGPLSSCAEGFLMLACLCVAPDDTQIKLSTKSFGTEAAGVAAGAIANCAASLTHADLSDVIAGRPEAEALAALRILSNALAQVSLPHGVIPLQRASACLIIRAASSALLTLPSEAETA